MALVGVSDKNKLVYLVVRGTLDASVEDWLLDFEFWQKDRRFSKMLVSVVSGGYWL